MTRIIFTLASALSLLLCVATCVMWVRSYWRDDQIGTFFDVRYSPGSVDGQGVTWGPVSVYRMIIMTSDRGCVSLGVHLGGGPGFIKSWRVYHKAYEPSPSVRISPLAFGSDVLDGRRVWEVSVTDVLPLAITSVLPAVWALRRKSSTNLSPRACCRKARPRPTTSGPAP
jgi:hypothetical protein